MQKQNFVATTVWALFTSHLFQAMEMIMEIGKSIIEYRLYWPYCSSSGTISSVFPQQFAQGDLPLQPTLQMLGAQSSAK